MDSKSIVLSGDYGYIDQITTTIKSIAYHVHNIKIYVINFDIPQEYFTHINYYLHQIDSELIDLKINPEVFNNEEQPKGHINKITYGRLLIPRLVSEDRVLYIDSDAIVDRDISELWTLDFAGHPLAAVHDVFADIFNAGIMLINNRTLKQDPSIVDSMLAAGRQKGITDADQTVLNQFFNHDYLELGLEYNYVIGYDRDVSLMPTNAPGYFKAMDECRNPKIIHYGSPDKPWKLTSSGRMRAKWWEYYDLDWHTIINGGPLPDLSRHPQIQFLTITASDQMLYLREIASLLPECEFHVVAFSEVSPTLLNYMGLHNIHVYPSVSKPRLNELMNQCTAYLDVNRGPKNTNLITEFAEDGRTVYSFDEEKAELPSSVNHLVVSNGNYNAMVNMIKEREN